jgi:hypothetical protein
MNRRLWHDHAFACASAILDMTKHLMREECHRDTHQAFYEAITACLQHYESQCARQVRRVGEPSKN